MISLFGRPVSEGRAETVRHGREMIDDLRLWGSRRCRQTDAAPKKTRWRVQVARDFDNHNAFLSEGGALAVVVESFPGTPRRR